jgi:thiosulfate dehydrogenase
MKRIVVAVALMVPAALVRADDLPKSPVPPKAGTKEVKLCDNQTTVKVSNDTPRTAAEGQKIADSLMAQWKEKHPDNKWVAGETQAHHVVPPADNGKLAGTGQSATYGVVTKQDVQVWNNETFKFAVYGSTVFHSGDELGSEIAVSCDMCHPDAANTHPETYPKFQPQLGRVALLRDMINWCIEHPVRGKVLAPDDPKMRALEAYIIAQRKGAPLDYGKR